jgi:hypothetical protein
MNCSIKILIHFPIKLHKCFSTLKHPHWHAYIITKGELEYVEAIFAYRKHEIIEKLLEDTKAKVVIKKLIGNFD